MLPCAATPPAALRELMTLFASSAYLPSRSRSSRFNEIVREHLVREGRIPGPALRNERLVSRWYTNAEKTLAAGYVQSTW